MEADDGLKGNRERKKFATVVRFVDSKCKKAFWSKQCEWMKIRNVCLCSFGASACVGEHSTALKCVCVCGCVCVCVWRRMKTSAWWVEKKREWKFFPNHLEKTDQWWSQQRAVNKIGNRERKKAQASKKARTMNQKLSPLFSFRSIAIGWKMFEPLQVLKKQKCRSGVTSIRWLAWKRLPWETFELLQQPKNAKFKPR